MTSDSPIQPELKLKQKQSTSRRRVAGFILILIVAAGLWMWGEHRSDQRRRLLRDNTEMLVNWAKDSEPRSRVVPQFVVGTGLDRQMLLSTVESFVKDPGAVGRPFQIVVFSGASPLTGSVRASHHARIIATEDGSELHLNAHVSEDARRVQYLGYAIQP